MNVSFKAIGANLRAARKAAHLTQAQAAELLGMTPLHYGRLERGERNASLPQLASAAEILHVPFPALLEGAVLGFESGSLQNASRLSSCSSNTLELIDDIINVLIKHDPLHFSSDGDNACGRNLIRPSGTFPKGEG